MSGFGFGPMSRGFRRQGDGAAIVTSSITATGMVDAPVIRTGEFSLYPGSTRFVFGGEVYTDGYDLQAGGGGGLVVQGDAQFDGNVNIDGDVTTASQLAPATYPRLAIPTLTASAASAKTLTNTEAYANYYGRADEARTSFEVKYNVLGSIVGANWAEIGIAVGTPVPGAGTTLTIVGWTSIAAAAATLGAKSVTIATSAVAKDDHVWLVYAANASSASPQLWASQIGDQVQAGTILQAGSSYRPSTASGATAFTRSASNVPTFVSQLW